MRPLLAIAFLFCSAFMVAKGGQGTYTIVGIAFSHDSISLKNVELTVRIGDKTTVVKTNAQGGFQIEVKWATACPSGESEENLKELNKELNPEYIYIAYKGVERKIKNDWERIRKIPHPNVRVAHSLHF